MNFTDYDIALKSKLLEVFPNVVNSSDDKALEDSEDSKAEITLPMISFWRLSNDLDLENNPSFGWTRGRVERTKPVDSEGRQLKYKQLGISPTYQIDIWSDRLAEVDQIAYELLIYLYEEPNLLISDPNLEGQEFTFPIEVTGVSMATDLSGFSETGAMFRQTLDIEVNSAVLTYPHLGKVAKTIELRTVSLVRGEDLD